MKKALLVFVGPAALMGVLLPPASAPEPAVEAARAEVNSRPAIHRGPDPHFHWHHAHGDLSRWFGHTHLS